MALSRNDILSLVDHKIETISAWGDEVCIKTFNGATRAALVKPTQKGNMPDDWMERIIVASVCDPEGNLLFTEKDIPALSQKNAVELEKVFIAAVELNGLSEQSVEKMKGESRPTPK